VSDPEYGCVWIGIKGGETSYRLIVCCADYTDRWMDRFVNAFLVDSSFRTQFLVDDRKSSRTHNQIGVVIDGQDVQVDEAIAPAIVALNERGVKTAFCCQGGPGTPYIALSEGRFPEELIRAWTGSGFRVDQMSVYADAPFGMSASQPFIQSLSDWMAGCLDTSGKSYRLGGSRKNSLPKLPAVQAIGMQKAIKNVIRMGNKAKFRDFAALRSGRDHYSSMPYDELVSLCDEKTLPPVHAIDDERVRASVLRWHLRGLPLDMAIHKVKVDQEISANSQKKGRR